MAYEIEHELDSETEIVEPKKFKVILLNDDYSTMDFVIEVLTTIFRKSVEEATAIMLNIHNSGKGICGIFTHEVASTKVAQVKNAARKNGFPLKAIMEEE